MIARALTTGDALVPGTMLGKYEVLTGLAVGGMAELYLARASGIEGFQKLVALKRIRPEHARSSQLVTMFLDEARLGASLQHANIAQVYDIGESPAGLFFTMELVAGRDVRRILMRACRRRARVPIEHALRIVIDAAAGLHAAHCKTGFDGAPLGIVHRDVSPANILVSYDGCVKVIDFGVAKTAHQRTETRAGTLKGKISYMSPEQCQGESVDRRSDVFALGIVLYELTTRRRLFSGENEFKIMTKIVEHDVPLPSSHCAGYAPELEAVVMKALCRDPEERYQSVQAMQLDLERFARTHGLVLSNVRLGKYMRRTFAAELGELEELCRRFSIPREAPQNDAPVDVDLSELEANDAVSLQVLPDMAAAPPNSSGVARAASKVRDVEPRRRRRRRSYLAAAASLGVVAAGLTVWLSNVGSRGEVELLPAAGALVAPAAEPSDPVRVPKVAPVAAPEAETPVAKAPTPPPEPPVTAEAPASAKAAPHVTVRARRKHASSSKHRRRKKHRSRPRKRRWDRDSPLPPR